MDVFRTHDKGNLETPVLISTSCVYFVGEEIESKWLELRS